MCSVLGGAAFITSDVDMFNKLRKAAADLGADAVIVMREGSSRAAWGSGSGSWNAYGGYLSASSWASTNSSVAAWLDEVRSRHPFRDTGEIAPYPGLVFLEAATSSQNPQRPGLHDNPGSAVIEHTN